MVLSLVIMPVKTRGAGLRYCIVVYRIAVIAGEVSTRWKRFELRLAKFVGLSSSPTGFLPEIYTYNYIYMSRCTVIRSFLAIFPTAPKSYATIFLGYRGPYIGPTNTNHTKKLIFDTF